MFAIVEFGSVIRGSNDEHSDKDLLIINERRSHKALRLYYEAEGYSVSTLTPGQLYAMQRRGSLFIQHLKFESNILLDYQGIFQFWLNGCEMVLPTEKEINRCLASIDFLYSWPNDPRIIGWKADTIYCLARDFFIKYLAGKSKLVFGINDISKALNEIEVFKSLDFHLLNSLREVKSSYRAGENIPQDTDFLLDSLFEYLVFGFGLSKTKVTEEPAELYIESLGKRSFNSAYERLRTLEAAYLIARSQGLYHPEHQVLMKVITTPNAYGSAQIRKKKEIEEYLKEVVALIAQQNDLPSLSLHHSSLIYQCKLDHGEGSHKTLVRN